MQGFFRCPVDNLHAEPLIARWIRHNVPNWREAVVVSKNAGGTKRVTSLADALKLNFGMVTTDRKRGGGMTHSMLLSQLESLEPLEPAAARIARNSFVGTITPTARSAIVQPNRTEEEDRRPPPDLKGLRVQTNGRKVSTSSTRTPTSDNTANAQGETEGNDYNDQRASEVTHGRLVQGHIVPDDFPSPTSSAASTTIPDDDPMVQSQASSFFNGPDGHALGGSGDAAESSDDEDEQLKDPKVEHMITLVGDVRNRTVLIIDDMIDKAGSWIAAAETVVKRGFAKSVYCIATHGVFGGDSLEQMQRCECIDAIVVTNSYPISEERAKNATKLTILDLSYLLSEAIRRNHYGESISPLFQHIQD